MTNTFTVASANRYGKDAAGLALRSTELLTALVQNHDATLAKLSTIAPLAASDISIDEDGNIIIDNKAFSSAYFTNPLVDNLVTNCSCNGSPNIFCS